MFEGIIINEEKIAIYGVSAVIIKTVKDGIVVRTAAGEEVLLDKKDFLAIPRKLSANELSTVFSNIKAHEHPLKSIA